MNPQRNHNGLFFWIIAVGFVLRFFRIGHYDFWYDEVHFFAYSEYLSSPQSIFYNLLNNATPSFLYHLFLSIWKTLGTNELCLRLPSLIFNLLTLIFAYRLFFKILDKNTALLSCLILSLSPLQVHYSQEASPYSLFELLSVVSFLIFFNFIKKNGKFSIGAFLCFINVIAVYTHYFALFIVCIQTFFLFIVNDYRYLLKKWLLFLGALAVFCLPLLKFILEEKSLFQAVAFWANPPGFYNLLIQHFVLIFGYNYDFFIFLTGMPLVGFLSFAGFKEIFVKNKNTFLLLFLIVFLPIFGTFIAVRFLKSETTFFVYRYFIFVAPFLSAVIASGLLSFGNLFRKIGGLLFVSLLFLEFINYYSDRFPLPENPYRVGVHPRKDFKGALSYVESNLKPEDVIILTSKSLVPSFLWYRKSNGNKIIHAVEGRRWLEEMERSRYVKMLCATSEAFRDLQTENINQETFSHKRIWFVVGDWEDDSPVVRIKEMPKSFRQDSYAEFKGVKVFCFQRE